MPSQTILITGAGGFLGSLLADTIVRLQPDLHDFRFILCDVNPPKPPTDPKAKFTILTVDLTQPSESERLFQTEMGKPDVIYSLHGIMSKGSEQDWDFGFRVNFDSTRYLLEAARRITPGVKFIFSSSVGVFGGKLPEVVLPETIATPEGAYGTAKLMCEYLITEYSRKGFVDGRVIRLPTITVRPGPPAAATTSFVSGIIREPLQGMETVCPIGSSIQDPILEKLEIWISSPTTVLEK
ncbi:NAD(P)-binding protein [Violaceomyces palustris]|uniref:NAD(P)-binding protein n=1 Tax=Violaceomyces palustris TaxID=1673888 RepID=A0ACD0NL33_9BASI|nr:NAD(P)-binding protein [Violaceomyces palustris]